MGTLKPTTGLIKPFTNVSPGLFFFVHNTEEEETIFCASLKQEHMMSFLMLIVE
jgi:hypothetical protein